MGMMKVRNLQKPKPVRGAGAWVTKLSIAAVCLMAGSGAVFMFIVADAGTRTAFRWGDQQFKAVTAWMEGGIFIPNRSSLFISGDSSWVNPGGAKFSMGQGAMIDAGMPLPPFVIKKGRWKGRKFWTVTSEYGCRFVYHDTYRSIPNVPPQFIEWGNVRERGANCQKLGYKSWHNAIDFRARKPTPVLSIFDGVVTFRKNMGSGRNCGQYVEVTSHNKRFRARYCHMSQVSVKVHTKVIKGTQIGLSGTSGTKDYHLHLRVDYRANSNIPWSAATAINPRFILPAFYEYTRRCPKCWVRNIKRVSLRDAIAKGYTSYEWLMARVLVTERGDVGTSSHERPTVAASMFCRLFKWGHPKYHDAIPKCRKCKPGRPKTCAEGCDYYQKTVTLLKMINGPQRRFDCQHCLSGRKYATSLAPFYRDLALISGVLRSFVLVPEIKFGCPEHFAHMGSHDARLVRRWRERLWDLSTVKQRIREVPSTGRKAWIAKMIDASWCSKMYQYSSSIPYKTSPYGFTPYVFRRDMTPVAQKEFITDLSPLRFFKTQSANGDGRRYYGWKTRGFFIQDPRSTRFGELSTRKPCLLSRAVREGGEELPVSAFRFPEAKRILNQASWSELIQADAYRNRLWLPNWQVRKHWLRAICVLNPPDRSYSPQPTRERKCGGI